MRVNFLGIIGLAVIILLVIWLCVKYIPGASDTVKDVIDNTVDNTQQETNNTENNETNELSLISNKGVIYELVC